MAMLIILTGVMVSRVYTDVKMYQTARTMYVQLIMFQLCLNEDIYIYIDVYIYIYIYGIIHQLL